MNSGLLYGNYVESTLFNHLNHSQIANFFMSLRYNFSSNGKYESIVGYSRAVKVGDFIFVSGTTGIGASSETLDSYTQAKRAINNVKTALNEVALP